MNDNKSASSLSSDEDDVVYEGVIKPYMFEPVEIDTDSENTDSDGSPSAAGADGGLDGRAGRRSKDG